VEFEDRNLKIEDFSGLMPNQILVASGSPRNRRLPSAIPEGVPVSQLSLSKILDKLSSTTTSPASQEIVRVVQSFREPRKAWRLDEAGNISDNGVSLAKARIAAAASIVYQSEMLGQAVPTFSVVGKDNNIAAIHGKEVTFLERPGFVAPSFAEESQIPVGWSIEGDGNEPAQPAEQIAQLYDISHPSNFLCVNSTTVLKISEKFCTPEGLRWLVDLSRPLDEGDFSTIRSFMLLQGDAGNTVMELFNYYSETPRKEGGERMYAIPGMVDWSRPPFKDHLNVWVSADGQAIGTELPSGLDQIVQQQGSWQLYTSLIENNKEIEDELVGASTHSLRQLIEGL
jgi:hypothetical protein